MSTLADAAKSALIVQNKSGGAALDLRVGNATTPPNDVAPMKVNSTKKVPNLNADRIDDREASSFANGVGGVATNADKLDGKDSSEFLGETEKAADADKLDGRDSADLLPGGVLPAGATVRGTYEIDGHAAAAGDLFGGDSMSFVYTLPSLPAVVFVPGDATPPAECPGTAILPQAAPGFLCVYKQGKNNLSQPTVYNSSPMGAVIYGRAIAAGDAYGYGRWAVTAPTPAQAQSLSEKESDASEQRREP